ncbi:MAG: CCC motif membrane protein [Bacteroidia bacterium]
MNPSEFESSTPQPNQFNQNTNFSGGTQPVPNSVGALVLGILSIVFCWCYGLLAIILGIIAIVLANQGEKLYKVNPQAYTISSYKNMKAGKICGIIGLCLGAVYLIIVVIYFVVLGTAAFGAFNYFK